MFCTILRSLLHDFANIVYVQRHREQFCNHHVNLFGFACGMWQSYGPIKFKMNSKCNDSLKNEDTFFQYFPIWSKQKLLIQSKNVNKDLFVPFCSYSAFFNSVSSFITSWYILAYEKKVSTTVWTFLFMYFHEIDIIGQFYVTFMVRTKICKILQVKFCNRS